MILPENTMVHTLCDYGGMLVDPFPENFMLIKMTSKDVGLGKFPYDMETTRHKIRTYASDPRDYYIIIKAIRDGVDYQNPKTMEMLRKDKIYGEIGEKGEKAYRAARVEWNTRDKEGRMKFIKLFPGAKNFIEKIRKIPYAEFSIITTTKAWNVKSTLEHLMGPLGEPGIRIFDRDYGAENYYDHINPRDYQFFKLREEGGLSPNPLTLDDMPENLEAAERWGVRPFAVSHGYGNPEKLSKYQTVTFDEMIDIVNDLSKK